MNLEERRVSYTGVLLQTKEQKDGTWAFLRKSETDWWIKYFKDLRDQTLYDYADPVRVGRVCGSVFCLCFGKSWNVQQNTGNFIRLAPLPMKHLPMDVQTPFTFCPRRQTLSYLHKTSTEDLAVTKDVCCVVQQDNFSQTFAELAHLILRENNLQIPSDLSQAEHFYIDLLGFIDDSVVLKLTSFIHEKGLSLSSCCVFSVLD